MKFIILLAAILAIVVALEVPVSQNKLKLQSKGPVASVIVGGNYASTIIPYQVYLLMAPYVTSTSYSLVCGGSFIHERFVLTAGHCVKGNAKFYVGFGTITFLQPLKSLISTESYLHSGFNITTYNNDIALIKLPSFVMSIFMAFNKPNIYPIRLPSISQQSTTFAGVTARASGFGLTSSTSGVSMTLKYADLPIISNAECALTYGNQVILPTNLCTRGAGIDTCYGDSGGPLAIKEGTVWTLVGVVSFGAAGYGCGAGYPSGFARVSGYLPWISSITGITLRP